MEPLNRAREIFFKYDGSSFHMSRDGADYDEYRRYSVPEQLEKQWLEEVIAKRLDMLDEPGNWAVVYVLMHHGDTRHLTRLTQAKPRGAFWQRCAYLEDVLRYVKMCTHAGAIDESQIRDAADYVLGQAKIIDRDAGQEDSRYRVQRIIEFAAALRSSTG